VESVEGVVYFRTIIKASAVSTTATTTAGIGERFFGAAPRSDARPASRPASRDGTC